ncbi:MAG: hypothetical protein RQM90_13735 [Methanoculleus sp.]
MTVEEEGAKPSVETVREPDFKVAYVDGVFGDLNPERGHLAFFYDVPEPRQTLTGIWRRQASSGGLSSTSGCRRNGGLRWRTG